MEGAEFGADHEHRRLRIRLAEGLGGPQRREGRVAAHKAEVVPLHGGIQAEGPDDLVVRAGIEESGAGNRDEVGDVRRLDAGQASRAFWAASMKSLVASVAKMPFRILVLGLQQQAGGGVEELGIFRLAVRGEFLHGRVPGVDGCGVKARVDEPGSEPGEPRLGGEHGPFGLTRLGSGSSTRALTPQPSTRGTRGGGTDRGQPGGRPPVLRPRHRLGAQPHTKTRNGIFATEDQAFH